MPKGRKTGPSAKPAARSKAGKKVASGKGSAKPVKAVALARMTAAQVKKEHDEMVRELIQFYLKEGHEIRYAMVDGYKTPPSVEGCSPDVISQYYRFPIMAEIGRCDTSGIDALVARMKAFYRQRQAKPNTRLHFAAREECLYPYQRRFAEAGIIVDRYILL